MNIRTFLYTLFLACIGSCLAALIIISPGLIWPDSMILFGLLALLFFLYLVLPLHALAVLTLIYASLKYRVFIKVLGYYIYLAIWCAVNALLFEEYLFTEIPKQIEQWRYEITHKDELALLRALHNDNNPPDLIASLLEKGADPNEVDRQFGIAPLGNAANNATVSEVELLLEHGALINHQTEIQYGGGLFGIVQLPTATALGLATLNQDSEQRFKIVSLLLEQGADVRIGSPMLGACGYADIPLIELLIKYDADLWVRDSRERGCLYYAAYIGHIELIEFLFERQAKIDPIDQQTPSLVDIAASRGHLETVIRLIEAGYKASQPTRLERLLEKTEDSDAKQKLKSMLESKPMMESKSMIDKG